MADIRAVIKRHPVLSYYAVVFAISWGSYFLLGGPSRFAATRWGADPLFMLATLLYVAGPTAAGLLMTGLVSGRTGYRQLLSRLLRWRVGIGWYAIALVATPLSYAAISLALSLISPIYLPSILFTADKASLVIIGLVSAVVVAPMEELGWTGFLIPHLRLRHGVLATGLFVGVLWGVWHFPLFWESDSFSGALPLAILLVRLLSWLPAYRVLLVWIYDRTESLLVVMLTYASLIASTLILPPVALSGVSLLISIVGWPIALWVVVGVLAWADRARVARQPFGEAQPAPQPVRKRAA